MLKFNADGKFTIMAFGDIHVHTNYRDTGAAKFRDMMALHNAALDEFQPDLCVYMGDNLSTSTAENEVWKEEFYQALLDITEPVRSRGIPYASILGNHEHDHGSEDEIVELYSKLPGCLMRNDAQGVRGNASYNELIMSSDGSHPAYNVWFLDSNNNCDNRSISHYDWVHEDQIAWYENKAAELKSLNGGNVIPAVLFQHIPVYEEYELLRKAKPWEIPFAAKCQIVNRKGWYVRKPGVEGYLGEGPCAPDFNGGQFASWKKTGDVKAAVFGHDHMNEFDGTYDGIRLMQTQTAGFGAYTNGCRSGVRVIVLDENNPDSIISFIKHFKEFGLKSESLGPVFRTLTDRQSINLTILRNVSLACAGAAAAGVAINNLRRKKYE